MDLINLFKKKARKNPQRIVLPEGEDERIVKAAGIVSEEGIAYPLLLGNNEKIKQKINHFGIDLANLRIIDPLNFPKISEYVSFYCKMRKDHSISKRIARLILKKSLNLGALMVTLEEADGLVAGAINLTASVIKSGVLMIGLRKGVSIPSSFFIMNIPHVSLGEKGLLIFADAAVNPDPDPCQLAEIAISTGRSAEVLLGWEPRVALLSFSTKRSASHPSVDKVIEATRIAQRKAPHLLVDGDLQADAALIPEIAQSKVKGSKVAGKANVLIFPNLDSANISYKLVQYLAQGQAYGPILQGFKRPINDLSRGASVEDIVTVITLTAVQAQDKEN
jgi:phosphate acetyltransferase